MSRGVRVAMIALITCVVIAAMTVVFGALAYLMSYLVIYLLGASQDAEMALTSQAVYVIGSILLAVAVGVSIRAAGGSVRWGTGVWVGAAVYLLASVPLAFVGHLWDEPWSDPLGMWLLNTRGVYMSGWIPTMAGAALAWFTRRMGEGES